MKPIPSELSDTLALLDRLADEINSLVLSFSVRAKRKTKVFFWYSKDQEQALRDIADTKRVEYVPHVLEHNGEELTYTEITPTQDPVGRWTDYKLIATGQLPPGATEETPWNISKS